MIPRKIKDKAYRLKRQTRSEHLEIEDDGRFYWAHLDSESVRLGRVKRQREAYVC